MLLVCPESGVEPVPSVIESLSVTTGPGAVADRHLDTGQQTATAETWPPTGISAVPTWFPASGDR